MKARVSDRRVLCGHPRCGQQLGRLRGTFDNGSFDHTIDGSVKLTFTLESGWRQSSRGVWALIRHANKHDQTARRPFAPAELRREYGDEIATFPRTDPPLPAILVCPKCGRLSEVESPGMLAAYARSRARLQSDRLRRLGMSKYDQSKKSRASTQGHSA
jgi:hypothetical protein